MALRRWKFVWGPLLAAAAVLILTLPPAIPADQGLPALLGFSYTPWYYPPGRAHREAVSEAVATQRVRLRQAVLADSILAAARGARALRSGDGAVTVVYEAPLTADSARVWLRAASAELDLYTKPASHGLPVVVALFSDPRRRADPTVLSETAATVRLGGEATGGRACIVAVPLIRRRGVPPSQFALVARGPSREPVGRLLDLCALEGRFGPPGSVVLHWRVWAPNWFWRNDQLTVRLSEARRNVRRDPIPRSWQVSFWYGEVTWVSVGCLDGAYALCARATGLDPVSRSAGEYYLGRRLLLAHLLARGTADQFAAFWRSSLPVGDALERAYHQSAGELAHEAMSHWYYVAPGNAATRSRAALAGLFWAGAALALAIVAGRRWKTEI